MTRVAVLADTHLPRASRALPPRVLEECAAADLILHAGDFVRMSVLAELEAYGPVQAVAGNCDDDQLVAALPVARVVPVEGAQIGMIHDSGPSAGRASRLRARFPGCQAVVFGHSHTPLVARAEGVLLVNPGSAIDRRREPVCTMAVLDVVDSRVMARLLELDAAH